MYLYTTGGYSPTDSLDVFLGANEVKPTGNIRVGWEIFGLQGFMEETKGASVNSPFYSHSLIHSPGLPPFLLPIALTSDAAVDGNISQGQVVSHEVHPGSKNSIETRQDDWSEVLLRELCETELKKMVNLGGREKGLRGEGGEGEREGGREKGL